MDYFDEGRRLAIQLFGVADTIDPLDALLSFLIVISAIVLLEHFFHELHHITNGSTFQDMILAIENELMIVGCMAFILKIILNTSDFLTDNWILSIEYADLLIPIVSFMYCFQGIALIVMGSIVTDFWSKAYYLSIYDILDDFYDLVADAWYIQYRWIPYVAVRSQLEFRIYHIIFCETYQIDRKAFGFDEYVRLAMDKHLINLVTIPLTAWAMVGVLFVLNYVRGDVLNWDVSAGCDEDKGSSYAYGYNSGNNSSYSSGYGSSRLLNINEDNPLFDFYDESGDGGKVYENFDRNDNSNYDNEGRLLAASSSYADVPSDCERESLTMGFLYTGVFLVLVTFLLVCLSRYYELQLMAARGITSIDDYDIFVQMLEENPSQSSSDFLKDRNKKLTEQELKEAINIMKRKQQEHPGHHHHGHSKIPGVDKVLDFSEYMYKNTIFSIGWIWVKSKLLTHLICTGAIFGGSKVIPADSVRPMTPEEDGPLYNKSVKSSPSSSSKKSQKTMTIEDGNTVASMLTKANAAADTTESVSQENMANKLNVNQNVLKTLQTAKLKLKKTAQVHHIDDRLRKLKDLVTNEEKMHAKDLHKIFFFNNPQLYHSIVTHLLMLISLYLGVWITHFVSHAHLMGLADGAGEFVTVLPALVASFFYGSITKSAVLLKCITKLDTDVLEEVLESAEESRDLGLQVKDKMMKKLSDMGDPQTALRLLFEEIDVDGSEVLSREEFHDFCVMLKLSFSKKKWRHIFREIDRNQNDEISYEELFLFLFPDNNAAMRQENRREAARKRQVLAKAESVRDRVSRKIASTTLSPRVNEGASAPSRTLVVEAEHNNNDVSVEEIDELEV